MKSLTCSCTFSVTLSQSLPLNASISASELNQIDAFFLANSSAPRFEVITIIVLLKEITRHLLSLI